ncbi:hypothetical protein CNR22_12505 [Sphingobacteriaceae bacterium]|nr:hypothetical protein CNR22_12505 [Sphingobacteriaceae bacterium]
MSIFSDKFNELKPLHKNTLYITFDGLSDPLGQSQILPYLCGIASQGFYIHILSCEKKDRLEKEQHTILSLIKNLPIQWEYILYDEAGGTLSRLEYVRKIRSLASKISKDKKISLVHCRSYLASLIGLSLRKKHNIPFIFDMRGFWADERIDGGIWKKNNFIQRFFYSYFKKKEQEFIKRSDAIVSLTNAAVAELGKTYSSDFINKKTSVIPCCADMQIFSKEHKTEISFPKTQSNDVLFIYTGSIGTWYYTKEMIDCMIEWKKSIPHLKLVILTKDAKELQKVLSAYSEEDKSFIFSTSSSHKDVPGYLALAKAAIFFIKPSYSKIASSPTKMAECWAMDLPIITNAGIGDNDLYFNKHKGGILLNDFTSKEYARACENYLKLEKTPGVYRKIALDHFDTKMAVQKYTSIYKKLTHDA